MKLTEEQRETLLNHVNVYAVGLNGSKQGEVFERLLAYVEDLIFQGSLPGPMLTTLEELRALPPGTVFLASDGKCYEVRTDERRDTFFRGFNGANYVLKRDHEAFLPVAPLTDPEGGKA